MKAGELIATVNQINTSKFHTVDVLKPNNVYICVKNVIGNDNNLLYKNETILELDVNYYKNRVQIQTSEISDIIDLFKEHEESNEEITTTKYVINAPQNQIDNTFDLKKAGNFLFKGMKKIRQGLSDFKELSENVEYLNATYNNITRVNN
jgi:hypothetical protein